MTQANADLARRWMNEVWNLKRAEAIDELMTEDGVGHSPMGVTPDRETFKNGMYAAFVAAFPDLLIDIVGVLADESWTATRWTATGTHTGDGLGIPPTGRAIRVDGVTWVRIVDGKMAEGWDYWDRAALFEALGVAKIGP